MGLQSFNSGRRDRRKQVDDLALQDECLKAAQPSSFMTPWPDLEDLITHSCGDQNWVVPGQVAIPAAG
jgi:hypothetical protein